MIDCWNLVLLRRRRVSISGNLLRKDYFEIYFLFVLFGFSGILFSVQNYYLIFFNFFEFIFSEIECDIVHLSQRHWLISIKLVKYPVSLCHIEKILSYCWHKFQAQYLFSILIGFADSLYFSYFDIEFSVTI